MNNWTIKKCVATASMLYAFSAVGFADQPIALSNFSVIWWSPGQASYPIQTSNGQALEFYSPVNASINPPLSEIVQIWPSPQNWSGFNALTATLTTNATYPINISIGVADSAGKFFQTNGLQVQPGPRQTFTVYFNNLAVASMGPPVNSFVFPNGAVDFTHASSVLFQMQNVSAPCSTFITNMSLVTNALSGIEDAYGQYSLADWPGKIHTDQDMQVAHQTEAATFQPAPATWDKYGGWVNGPQLQATGRFRTQKVNGRWWFVTPEGHLYYASVMGDPDYSDKNSLVDVPGTLRRQLFTSVPSAGIFGSPPYTWNAGIQGSQLFNFYLWDLYTLDGSAWQTNWNSRTLNRLNSWGFNTLGFYLNAAFMTQPTKPYMQLIGSFGQNPTITLPTGGAVPDPFDPTFATIARQNIMSYPNISQWATDPYCVGLFVDNEIPWEMGWYPIGNPEGYVTPRTVLQMIVQPGATNAKTAFMAQLQKEYGTISNLNAAWGLSLPDWNGFLQTAITLPIPLTAPQMADCKTFLSSMTDLYYQTIATILHSLFPNTLYLGSRLVATNVPLPDLAASAAKYADVVSINYYGSQLDASLFSFSNGLGKPLLISEFAFESPSDSGMFPAPTDGIAKSPSQAARAGAYTAYVQSVMQNPAFVGFEWLALMDFPLTGIAGTANGEAGFVSNTDGIYAPLVQAASTINRSIYTTLASAVIPSSPTIASLQPSVITAGDPSFSLTVNGTNLENGCTIYWNGQFLTTTFVKANSVNASVPASYFVSVGTATVQVINPDGGISNTLSFGIVPQATITSVTSSNDLSGVRIYPNPFRSARGDSQIIFDQLPAGSTVKIFTVSSRLVKTLSAPAGIAPWDLTNDSGDKVASGIYLYLITDGQGNKTHGKFTIIR